MNSRRRNLHRCPHHSRELHSLAHTHRLARPWCRHQPGKSRPHCTRHHRFRSDSNRRGYRRRSRRSPRDQRCRHKGLRCKLVLQSIRHRSHHTRLSHTHDPSNLRNRYRHHRRKAGPPRISRHRLRSCLGRSRCRHRSRRIPEGSRHTGMPQILRRRLDRPDTLRRCPRSHRPRTSGRNSRARILMCRPHRRRSLPRRRFLRTHHSCLRLSRGRHSPSHTRSHLVDRYSFPWSRRCSRQCRHHRTRRSRRHRNPDDGNRCGTHVRTLHRRSTLAQGNALRSRRNFGGRDRCRHRRHRSPCQRCRGMFRWGHRSFVHQDRLRRSRRNRRRRRAFRCSRGSTDRFRRYSAHLRRRWCHRSRSCRSQSWCRRMHRRKAFQHRHILPRRYSSDRPSKLRRNHRSRRHRTLDRRSPMHRDHRVDSVA